MRYVQSPRLFVLVLLITVFTFCSSNQTASDDKQSPSNSSTAANDNSNNNEVSGDKAETDNASTDRTPTIQPTTNNEIEDETDLQQKSKYGKWETDAQGNQFRESYALKDYLKGYQLVKYASSTNASGVTKFTLCSDGSLAYYSNAGVYVDDADNYGSNSSVIEDRGTWRAIEDKAGLQYIEMKSSVHNTTTFLGIEFKDKKTYLYFYQAWQRFYFKKINC